MVADGANIDTIDNDGYTALIWAGKSGSFRIIQVLIAAGANIDMQNTAGETALYQAAYSDK